MVVTTMNSTHKPKGTELEIRTTSQYLNCGCSVVILCLSLFGADSMIRLKLHIRKEGTLLQNMQHFSCNLVGMSCPCKIRFCNTVPAVVIALGHPEPFNHSPGHLSMKTLSPPNHDPIFVVTKGVRPHDAWAFSSKSGSNQC